jgi:hypothetical protein
MRRSGRKPASPDAGVWRPAMPGKIGVIVPVVLGSTVAADGLAAGEGGLGGGQAGDRDAEGEQET